MSIINVVTDAQGNPMPGVVTGLPYHIKNSDG